MKYSMSEQDLQGEIWRPVYQWDSYQVSNKGRCRHVEKVVMDGVIVRTDHTVLRPLTCHMDNFDQTPFYVVEFESKNNKDHRIRKSLARLVALTFIPNPNGYMYLEHIDRDYQNNCIENLEWVHSATKYTEKVPHQLKGESVTSLEKHSLPGEHWYLIDGYSRFIISDMGRMRNYLSLNRNRRFLNPAKGCEEVSFNVVSDDGVARVLPYTELFEKRSKRLT